MFIYFIYKTTNLLNNKVYIGAHLSNTLSFDGYLGSGIAIKRAVLKYGEENFSREILEIVSYSETRFSKKDWAEKIYPIETKWIKIYSDMLGVKNIYNRSSGGFGGSTTKTSKWYYNPNTKESKMFFLNDIIPYGWIKGRPKYHTINGTNKNTKLYTNIISGEEKYFSEIPSNEWKIGSAKQKKSRQGENNASFNKRTYVNKEQKKYIFCAEENKPSNFEQGTPRKLDGKLWRTLWTKIKIE